MAPYWDALGAWLLAQLSVMALIRDAALVLGALWLAALVWAGIRFLQAWDGWPSRRVVLAAAAKLFGPLVAWPLGVLFGSSPADERLQLATPATDQSVPKETRLLRWWRSVSGWVASVRSDRISSILLFGASSIVIVFGLWIGIHLLPILSSDTPTTNEQGELLAHRVGIAALVGLISLPLLLVRSIINERQTRTSERQIALAEKGNVTERIIKATELLGARHEEKRTVDGEAQSVTVPTIEVRLGAIYSLERVARESPEDHLTIMETFAAYVRQNHAPVALPLQGGDVADFNPVRLREDVSAVLSVIARRNRQQHEAGEAARRAFRWRELPLAGCDLRGVFTQDNARDENLREVDLRYANLGSARLLGADLYEAKLAHARLVSASLNGARIWTADLREADLGDAVLISTDLWASNLAMANLSGAFLWGAQVSGADLTGANLVDARIVDIVERDGEPGSGPVRGLSQSQVDRAFVDVSMAEQLTALGLTLPSHHHPNALTDDVEIAAAWADWKERRPWQDSN